jgi:hypothetical protein
VCTLLDLRLFYLDGFELSKSAKKADRICSVHIVHHLNVIWSLIFLSLPFNQITRLCNFFSLDFPNKNNWIRRYMNTHTYTQQRERERERKKEKERESQK